MPKNPCKRTKQKLFCPRNMFRYDECPGEYPIQWICMTCSKCLLSEAAAKKHSTNCSGQPRQSNEASFIPTTTNEESSYICNYCNMVFTKRATLKKHLEEHEKSSSQLDSDLSGNEVEGRTIKTENSSDEPEI